MKTKSYKIKDCPDIAGITLKEWHSITKNQNIFVKDLPIYEYFVDYPDAVSIDEVKAMQKKRRRKS